MIRLEEKKPLEQRDREHIIYALDKAWENQETVSENLHLFDDFDITLRERNLVILESDFKNDEKLVAMLTLFG